MDSLPLLLLTVHLAGWTEIEWHGSVDWPTHDSIFASTGGRVGPFAAMAI